MVYLILAVQAVRAYARDRQPSRWWLAVSFGVLGLITAVALIIPETDSGDRATFVRRILVALLVVVPYALFRFTATFSAPRRVTRVVAPAVTAGLAVWIFFEPTIPVRGEPITGSFRVYVLVLVAQWVGLSVIAVASLWRRRDGQALVARRRMEMMAAGAALFAIALIIAGAGSGSATAAVTWQQLLLQILTLVAGPLFLVGFAPPSWIVDILRRPEIERQRQTHVGLAGAESREQIFALVLPRAVETVGGSAAVIMDEEGEVITSVGSVEEIEGLAEVPSHSQAAIEAPLRGGRLVVRVGPAAPFFGDRERQMLNSLAAIAEIALGRAELVEHEREARRQVEAANAALRDFVAAASHDLRTPLTVIRGFAEMLDDHWDQLSEPDKRTYFDSIVRQTDHLNRMVEDLLTVSRIDAQAVAPRIEVMSVASVAAEIVATMPDDRRMHVRLGISADADVVADPEHVRRMIGNYLENAFNYGAPPIEVRASRSGDWVEVRVVDHGPGVPEQFRSRLFERFARADKRQSKSLQGTGLGLTIVQGLARACGGDAWFEPSPAGATFALRLPAAAITDRKAG